MVACLIAGHPGHEWVVHGWLSRHQPRVFVLTDGSGGASLSRVDFSAQLLQRVGCAPGSIFGALTCRAAYDAMLARDERPFVAIVRQIVSELRKLACTLVVSDAIEGYNPVHDLTRVLADEVARMLGPTVGRLEVGLVDPPLEREASAPVIAVRLSDAEWDEKRAAAERYGPLQHEYEAMLASRGVDGLRLERLHPVDRNAEVPTFGLACRYERLGEERVRAGRYGVVLREADHLLPLVERIRAQLREPEPRT